MCSSARTVPLPLSAALAKTRRRSRDGTRFGVTELIDQDRGLRACIPPLLGPSRGEVMLLLAAGLAAALGPVREPTGGPKLRRLSILPADSAHLTSFTRAGVVRSTTDRGKRRVGGVRRWLPTPPPIFCHNPPRWVPLPTTPTASCGAARNRRLSMRRLGYQARGLNCQAASEPGDEARRLGGRLQQRSGAAAAVCTSAASRASPGTIGSPASGPSPALTLLQRRALTLLLPCRCCAPAPSC